MATSRATWPSADSAVVSMEATAELFLGREEAIRQPLYTALPVSIWPRGFPQRQKYMVFRSVQQTAGQLGYMQTGMVKRCHLQSSSSGEDVTAISSGTSRRR